MTSYQKATSPVSRKILFLLPFPPRLDAAHGGGRATAQLLAELGSRHQVALLYLRSPREETIDEVLRQRSALCEEILKPDTASGGLQPWKQQLRALVSVLQGKPLWVLDWTVPEYMQRARALVQEWRPEIIQLEYHLMGQYLPALSSSPAPRVLVQHDPGAPAARGRLNSHQAKGRWMPYLDLLAWERYERAVQRKVQAIIVFTQRDRQELARSAGETPLIRIPLGTVVPGQALNPIGSPPPSLLFFGNFIHPPNVDAALRLVRSIYPRVREQYPGVRLYIVGDHAPPEIRELAGDQVVVTGYVSEVAPYLDRAALVIAPLRLGGGMRIKMLEALAAGKAVVASPLAVEGLDGKDGEHWAAAETDEEFREVILDLLSSPEKRAALGSRAREWACANLGWGASVAAYEALYQRLIERSG